MDETTSSCVVLDFDRSESLFSSATSLLLSKDDSSSSALVLDYFSSQDHADSSLSVTLDFPNSADELFPISNPSFMSTPNSKNRRTAERKYNYSFNDKHGNYFIFF